jgi:hypothetical protein
MFCDMVLDAFLLISLITEFYAEICIYVNKQFVFIKSVLHFVTGAFYPI